MYGLLIKLFLSDFLSVNLRKILAVVTWISVIIVAGLMIYVNYYLPHGPSYEAGEVCLYDGEGPCGIDYREDLRDANIPNWAKFLRTAKGDFLFLGLLFAGMILSGEKVKNHEE